MIRSSDKIHTPRTAPSKKTLSCFRPKKCEIPVAHSEVSWVVVSFANTPFRAAQAPEASA